MSDRVNLTDYLILLLSSDWCLPYWPEIGIEVDQFTKTAIQQGCRNLVVAMLDGAESYYFIDLSSERRRDTTAQFRLLLKECQAEASVLRTLEEWTYLSHETLHSLTWYVNPTVMVVVDKQMEGRPSLDPSIREVVERNWKNYSFAARPFPELSEASTSEWDLYLRSIFDPPDALGNQLWAVLLSHSFKAFWGDVSAQLTSSQLRELGGWYKAMTMDLLHEVRPDLIPPYIEGSSSAG